MTTLTNEYVCVPQKCNNTNLFLLSLQLKDQTHEETTPKEKEIQS